MYETEYKFRFFFLLNIATNFWSQNKLRFHGRSKLLYCNIVLYHNPIIQLPKSTYIWCCNRVRIQIEVADLFNKYFLPFLALSFTLLPLFLCGCCSILPLPALKSCTRVVWADKKGLRPTGRDETEFGILKVNVFQVNKVCFVLWYVLRVLWKCDFWDRK